MKNRMDEIILVVAGSVFVAGLSLTGFSFWFQHNLSQKDNQQVTVTSAKLPAEPYAKPLVAVSDKQAPVVSNKALAAIPETSIAVTKSEPQQVNNPSPNYIAKILSQTPEDSKATVANSFIGKHISWDATTTELDHRPGNYTVLYAAFGLHLDLAPVQSFSIPVELPNSSYLLQIPQGSPIHVEGTIESFDAENTPILKDVVVTRLPYAREKTPNSRHQ
jgi:hypothetical protein